MSDPVAYQVIEGFRNFLKHLESERKVMREEYLKEYKELCNKYKMIIMECLDRSQYEYYLDIKKVDTQTLEDHIESLESRC